MPNRPDVACVLLRLQREFMKQSRIKAKPNSFEAAHGLSFAPLLRFLKQPFGGALTVIVIHAPAGMGQIIRLLQCTHAGYRYVNYI